MSETKCEPGKIISQLHRIEGQVHSIESMYQAKRDIEEIIRVVKAARASLDSLTKLLVVDKLNGCYDKEVIIKRKELTKLIDVLFDIT
jgi:DNA-binding FrmR family transcriptional regulator